MLTPSPTPPDFSVPTEIRQNEKIRQNENIIGIHGNIVHMET